MVINRCFGCMEITEGEPCPLCGYTPETKKLSYVLRPGTILKGKYLVGKLLGQGGFGLTYIGWDLGLNRKVAIKEYYPSGQVSRQSTGGTVLWYASEAAQAARVNGKEMFLKEARKMSKVSDIEQVVRIYDLFQENDTAYICMAFAEGHTLKDHLREKGIMPWAEVKRVFLPVLEAMSKVHAAGLVHRDVSPDNLMLQPDGSIKILDLGAAKDMKLNSGISSMQVAKSGFSPLEQYVQRGRSGTWTDVYAMAATIYYALTGHIPPTAVDRIDHDRLDWDLPQLRAIPPKALDAMKRAMAIRIENRIHTMEEFSRELWPEIFVPREKIEPKNPHQNPAYQNSVPQNPVQQAPVYQDPMTMKKKRPGLGLIAAVVVVLCFLVGISHSMNTPTEAPQGEDLSDQVVAGKSTLNFQQEMNEIIANCELETYEYENGSRMEMYFDQQDREHLRIFANTQGQDEFIFLAEYDENGNLLKHYGFENQQLMRESTWVRNADGKATEVTAWDSSTGLVSTLQISYDSQGRETSYRKTDGSGNILLDATSTYDAEGKETYSGTNQGGDYFTYTYDSNGNLLEYVFKDGLGNQRFRGSYQYDDRGMQTAEYHYDENDKLSSWAETYYFDRQPVKIVNHYTFDEEEYFYEYEYIYGPKDIQFGRIEEIEDSRTCYEDVTGIADSVTLRSFVTNSDQTYQINFYNWDGYSTANMYYDASGELQEEWKTFYDESGTETGTVIKEFESDGSSSIREYDGQFNRQNTRTYDASGILLNETQYQYDSDGNEIGQIFTMYDEDGSYTVTERNADYDIVSQKTYDADGNLIRTE